MNQEVMFTNVQYLQQVAQKYGFHLNMGQMKIVGLIAIIAILIAIIYDVPRRFRRPKGKKKDRNR